MIRFRQGRGGTGSAIAVAALMVVFNLALLAGACAVIGGAIVLVSRAL